MIECICVIKNAINPVCEKGKDVYCFEQSHLETNKTENCFSLQDDERIDTLYFKNICDKLKSNFDSLSCWGYIWQQLDLCNFYFINLESTFKPIFARLFNWKSWNWRQHDNNKIQELETTTGRLKNFKNRECNCLWIRKCTALLLLLGSCLTLFASFPFKAIKKSLRNGLARDGTEGIWA